MLDPRVGWVWFLSAHALIRIAHRLLWSLRCGLPFWVANPFAEFRLAASARRATHIMSGPSAKTVERRLQRKLANERRRCKSDVVAAPILPSDAPVIQALGVLEERLLTHMDNHANALHTRMGTLEGQLWDMSWQFYGQSLAACDGGVATTADASSHGAVETHPPAKQLTISLSEALGETTSSAPRD